MTSPADYAGIIKGLKASGGELSPQTRWRLVLKAFRMTADYDRAISARLSKVGVPEDGLPPVLDLRGDRVQSAPAPRKLRAG